ncbi:MAG TPA: hypothetical protein P5307_15095, partial [Pirellulaceae bacterium]|nr:hypothetical protein [Pirellulaceae bacterium]
VAEYRATTLAVNATHDSKKLLRSIGNNVPRWTCRPQEGSAQWVEARFAATKQVRQVYVEWMQD